MPRNTLIDEAEAWDDYWGDLMNDPIYSDLHRKIMKVCKEQIRNAHRAHWVFEEHSNE